MRLFKFHYFIVHCVIFLIMLSFYEIPNNTTVKYLASYRDVRYLNAVTMAMIIYKDGDILFEDINVKISVSKDENGKWQLVVEKIN